MIVWTRIRLIGELVLFNTFMLKVFASNVITTEDMIIRVDSETCITNKKSQSFSRPILTKRSNMSPYY